MALPPGPFRRTGLPAFIVLSAAGSSGGGSTASAGPRYDFGTAYAKWGLRCKVTGGTTECSVQLLGTVGTSSDANAALVPLTTWTLSANSCDSVVWVVDKPVTSIMAQVTTMGLSSGAIVSAWITGTP